MEMQVQRYKIRGLEEANISVWNIAHYLFGLL